jgi:hypothetical protein
MPYLQLDVDGPYPPERKRALAWQLCERYAALMKVDVRRVSVAIRECGAGAVWRIVDGEPVAAAVLMLDIRRGRPSELRMQLAQALIADCVTGLGLREDRLNVEFTQHAGDEMYHPTLGGYSPQWSAQEQ